MTITVMIPTQIVYDERAEKITIETSTGRNTVLPRHIDFIAVLVPGIIQLWPPGKPTVLIAADAGVFVKQGKRVRVSVRNAIPGGDLGTMRETVERHYRNLTEQERKNRSSVTRLEKDLARRVYDYSKG